MRTALLVALVTASALAAQPALAEPSCHFRSVSSVDFGAYNVYATSASNGVGSLAVRCSGGGRSFAVTLSAGQSNSYASRFMTSGNNQLNYNLYTSAARSVVWGDGSGGSSSMAAARNSTTTLDVFGQIPAGQDAAVGLYSDNITATVDF